jgi:hypothetical protein
VYVLALCSSTAHMCLRWGHFLLLLVIFSCLLLEDVIFERYSSVLQEGDTSHGGSQSSTYCILPDLSCITDVVSPILLLHAARFYLLRFYAECV